MKKAISVLAAVAVVALIGFKISQDPFFERFVVKPTTTVAPAPTNTLVAPSFMTTYASAFCAQDAATVAAGTAIPDITEEDVATYFANEGVFCINFRYLGAVNDEGQMRYVYVLTFDMGREDWFVFTTDGEMVTSFRRG